MKKTTPKHFRQGDVLVTYLSASTENPKDCKEQPLTGMGPVLALGEVTGHHHTVVAEPQSYNPVEDLPDYDPKFLDTDLRTHAQNLLQQALDEANTKNIDMTKPAARLFTRGEADEEVTMLLITRPTLLRHEEHPAIYLDVGTYKVTRQQEFSPEGWRNVAD